MQTNKSTTLVTSLRSFCYAVALLLGACSSAGDTATGGETHFLSLCSSSAACGGELECACGVCTLPCSQQQTCAQVPLARCIEVRDDAQCGGSLPAGLCDATCASDGDCKALSAMHTCEEGVCRALGDSSPTGGDASDPTKADSGAAAGGAGSCSAPNVSANEVLLLGDSFMALDHQITAFLEDLARSAGVLSVGERYRDSSRLLGNSLALNSEGIADQYLAAAEEAPVRLVIMTGGGADALLGTCDFPDECPVLTAAATAAETLLARMATDGVEQVVYMFYPDPQDPEVRANIDALRPLIEQVCTASAVPCHWLDLRPAFAGNYDEYVLEDGLNPTAAGSRATAEAIWALLRQECPAE